MKLAAVFTILFLPLMLADTSPWDSACRAIWLFNMPCSRPNRALVHQVKVWSSNRCEDDEEKCMYKVIRSSSTNLEVVHKSRDLAKTTLMYFEFYPPESPQFCKVWAYSVTIPVNGTDANDFCLFHNLFEGSGLTSAPGYREISNEKMCPSITTASCLQNEDKMFEY